MTDSYLQLWSLRQSTINGLSQSLSPSIVNYGQTFLQPIKAVSQSVSKEVSQLVRLSVC